MAKRIVVNTGINDLGPNRRAIDYNKCSSCGSLKQRKAKLCFICRRASFRGPKDDTVYMIDAVECRRIAITKIKYATVDATDYDWLNQWNWAVNEDKKHHIEYASRHEEVDGKRTKIYMHRLIAATIESNRPHTDHENKNGLDNRRNNLRPSNVRQNFGNKGPTKRNRSGFKGVSLHKPSGFWYASVGAKGGYLGCFKDKIEAAKAYDKAAVKFYGEFAWLNFPEDYPGHVNGSDIQ